VCGCGRQPALQAGHGQIGWRFPPPKKIDLPALLHLSGSATAGDLTRVDGAEPFPHQQPVGSQSGQELRQAVRAPAAATRPAGPGPSGPAGFPRHSPSAVLVRLRVSARLVGA
jgi:hypothetical protein